MKSCIKKLKPGDQVHWRWRFSSLVDPDQSDKVGIFIKNTLYIQVISDGIDTYSLLDSEIFKIVKK